MNLDIDRAFDNGFQRRWQKQSQEEIIDRGMQAAALLEHPLLKEALSDIADMCLRHFAAADANDHDALMAARRMLETANEFQNVFKRMVTEGRNAATKADYMQPEVM